MANYYGFARTNYFRVKDATAFKNEVDTMHDLKLVGGADGMVGLLSNDESGWPTSRWNEAAADYEDTDWEAFFMRHLADEEVAIVMEIGNEKMRYLNGYATAYNNRGATRTIGLYQIYELAKDLGKNITEATY